MTAGCLVEWMVDHLADPMVVKMGERKAEKMAEMTAGLMVVRKVQS
jgi:hypothetical protein